MPSRVVFVVPSAAADVARVIHAHGGRGDGIPTGMPAAILAPALAGLARQRREVAFEGRGAAAGAESLCLVLDEARVPYVSLVEGRLDPSMCTPVPGRVTAFLPRLSEEVLAGSLPLGFQDAALDVRTLSAAGLPLPGDILAAVVADGPDGWADAAERMPRPAADAGFEDAAA